jgi:hypothetical protein
MDDTSYSRAVLQYGRRRAASRIAIRLMIWLAPPQRSRRAQPELMDMSVPPMGPRVSGVEVRRPQAADGLSPIPRLPRRRLMLGNAGGRIDTREFHRSADVVKKAANLAQKS